MLSDAGYEVTTAVDGREALEKVETSCPDLLVLDLMMPVMDGWAVLRRLQETGPPPLVVVLSAFADEWQALQLGAWECLHKPFKHDELLAACARALAGRH